MRRLRLLAVALGCLAPGAASAGPPVQPAETPEAALPAVVLMVPEQGGDLDERALATVAAHLRELELELVDQRFDPGDFDLRALVERSREVAEGEDARGVVWLDLPRTADRGPALYVLERGGDQLYGRQFAADLGEAVALEMLANVAALAAVALVEGRAIELHPPVVADEAPQPQPQPQFEPEAEPEPETQPGPGPTPAIIERSGTVVPVRRPWLRLRAGYRGTSYTDLAPWQSSISIAVGLRPHPQAHLELVYDVAPATTLRAPELTLVLRRFPFALAGGWSWGLPRDWDLELSGRVGLEPTRRAAVVAVATDPDLELAAPELRWVSGAELGLAAGVRLHETVRLSFGLGLAALFTRATYSIRDAGPEGMDTRRLLALHPVRALTWAGLDFDLVWR